MTRLLAPRLWPGHLLLVVLVAAATGLGLWQLHAWHEHRALAARDLVDAAPAPLVAVMGGDDPFPARYVGQPVTLDGRWLPEGTVFVSGREHDGRRGYWVVTPLLVDGTDSAMPVVRGWSAGPRAAAPSGTAEVTGWLEPGEGEGAEDADPDDDVLPELRIASLVQHVDRDLYGGFVISRAMQPDDASAGLAGVRPTATPDPGTLTALRNLLYAVEWWVFGLFALGVWARWCRDVLAAPPTPVASTS